MSVIKFDQFFLAESQSKKMKQYFTFSVVLQWYRENKAKIAQVLGVSEDELATEDDLMEESYGLVNHVINTQIDGNSGRTTNDWGSDIQNPTYGFSSFKPLERHLIHDILHNMFHVQEKQFRKSLSDIEYTESEVFEEIEVLGIEESFMKYMNIRYPKTDFINANINMLVSYMMMWILKNDPERVGAILDGEVEPYLEIYGKQYPVKGSAFETVFDLFRHTGADDKNYLNSSEDLKKYLIHIYNVATGIEDSGGDRANYPRGGYFGEKSFDEADVDDQEKAFKNSYSNSKKYTLIDVDNEMTIIELSKILKMIVLDAPKGFKFGKSIKVKAFNSFKIAKPRKKKPKYVDPNQLNLFSNESIKYDTLENVDIESGEYTGMVAIPILYEHIDDENGDVDMEKWFDWLENEMGLEMPDFAQRTLVIDDTTVQRYNSKKSNSPRYDFIDREEASDRTRESFSEDLDNNYDDDHEFITKEYYEENKTMEEMARLVMNSSDARSILRRNFRVNDVVRNNRNMGNLKTKDYSKKTDVINTKNPADKYINFKGDHDLMNEYSVSKDILSDNGKTLKILMDQLRGYMIKNYSDIKKKSKSSLKIDANTMKDFNSFTLENLNKMLSALTKWDGDIRLDITVNKLAKIDLTAPFYTILSNLKGYQVAKRVMDNITFDDISNMVAKNGITNRTTFDKCKELVSNIDDLISGLDTSNPLVMKLVDDIENEPNFYVWGYEFDNAEELEEKLRTRLAVYNPVIAAGKFMIDIEKCQGYITF